MSQLRRPLLAEIAPSSLWRWVGFLVLISQNLFAGAGLKLWQSADPHVAGEAILDLGQPLDNATRTELIAALTKGADHERKSAAVALLRAAPQGDDVVVAWIQALSDPQTSVRWHAALALGRLAQPSPAALAALRHAADDNQETVRWAAAWSLRQQRAPLELHPKAASDLNVALASQLPPLLKKFSVPGVSVALWEGGRVVGQIASGVRVKGETVPIDADTVFEACSMTKPVLAHLALLLVQEGQLSLDEPLSLDGETVWIAPREEWLHQITVRRLLLHTTGLPNWRPGGEERPGALALAFEPGTRFSYSGEGYYFLQRVIERKLGRSLEEIAGEKIFRPLGLKRTSFVWRDAFSRNAAGGHGAEGQPLQREYYIRPNAGYSLYTTPSEYAQILALALGGEGPVEARLTAELQQEQRRPQILAAGREPEVRQGLRSGVSSWRCLGWVCDETLLDPVYYHSGANSTGFRCYSQYDPVSGRGLVIMTNSTQGAEVWMAILRAVGDW